MSENLFRIGGVYRNGIGDGPFRVIPKEGAPAGYVGLNNIETGNEMTTAWRLLDGQWSRALGSDNHCMHLLPGELHQINGQWLPIEDPELVALQTRPQHVEASCEEEKPASGLATLIRKEREKLEASGALERNRPPLPGYGQRTPFDPFKGFYGPADWSYMGQTQSDAKPFADLSLDAPEQFRAPRSI